MHRTCAGGLFFSAAFLLSVGTAPAAEITPSPSGVRVSSAQTGNPGTNTVDGNFSTRWSADGDGQWIEYDLGGTQTVQYVRFAFYAGNTRQARFDVQVSSGSTWATVWSGSSSGTSTGLETFDFADQANVQRVRLLGHGNTVNTWNSVLETRVAVGSTPPPPPPPPPAFKQIGYLPSWAGSVSNVQFQYLTHVNYAFALPNSNGTLKPIENASKLSSLVGTAHSNGVKVLLSIGGWNDGNDSAFESLAASSSGRTAFVNACLNTVNQYGLDGIDIDWEYPDPGSSATNYQNLMNQLCSALHGRGKLCTAAVVAQGSTGGGVTSTVFGYVDYLQIMAYDANNGNHSSYAYAESSLNYWRNRGLPKAKAVLGVPFYARPSWAGYNQLLAAGCSPTANSCSYQGQTNYYNGKTLISQKRTLVQGNGGGIMCWELSQDVNDSRSLLRSMAGF